MWTALAQARLSHCSLLLILFVSLFTRLRIICSLLRDYLGNILDRKNFSSRARCCRISILERFIMFLPQCAGTLSTLGLQNAQFRFEQHTRVHKMFFNTWGVQIQCNATRFCHLSFYQIKSASAIMPKGRLQKKKCDNWPPLGGGGKILSLSHQKKRKNSGSKCVLCNLEQ